MATLKRGRDGRGDGQGARCLAWQNVIFGEIIDKEPLEKSFMSMTSALFPRIFPPISGIYIYLSQISVIEDHDESLPGHLMVIGKKYEVDDVLELGNV